MGGRSFPCLASRYGLSLLQMLQRECTLFQGKPPPNCWWTGFWEMGYNPALG
jgi:hypothetical protein